MSSNIIRIGGLLSHTPSHHGILQVSIYKKLSLSLFTRNKQYITRTWPINMTNYSDQAKLCRGIYLGLLFSRSKEDCLNIEIMEKDVINMITNNEPSPDELCNYYKSCIYNLTKSSQWTGISYSGYKLNWVDF